HACDAHHDHLARTHKRLQERSAELHRIRYPSKDNAQRCTISHLVVIAHVLASERCTKMHRNAVNSKTKCHHYCHQISTFDIWPSWRQDVPCQRKNSPPRKWASWAVRLGPRN